MTPQPKSVEEILLLLVAEAKAKRGIADVGIDDSKTALRQLLLAGVPGKMTPEDAAIVHGWLDDEYLAHNLVIDELTAYINKITE